MKAHPDTNLFGGMFAPTSSDTIFFGGRDARQTAGGTPALRKFRTGGDACWTRLLRRQAVWNSDGRGRPSLHRAKEHVFGLLFVLVGKRALGCFPLLLDRA
jgi:hypothetical protein